MKKPPHKTCQVYCELHGMEDYFIEKFHPDCNGKMFADLVAKCGLIICTFGKQDE